jgi:hypothetical protein
MDPFGTLLGIAHVLKRAYDLYTSCKAAPEEIRLAADHIHTMALVLEGVKSDLIHNPRSFVHQKTDIAKTRTHNLKRHVANCEGSLKRMGGLLGRYQGFKQKGGLGAWDKFRWSKDGKKEIAECKADLVLCTSMLDLFLSKEGLSVLWKLESMMEAMMKRFEALEVFQPSSPSPKTGEKRPRSDSNVGRTLVLSLVIGRLRKVLLRYRRKKMGKKPAPKPTQAGPGPRRPKPISRTNTGFGISQKRNDLAKDYATKIANASITTPTQKKQPRARTPSPDFYYIPGGTATPPLGPVRRSSSMQRIIGMINNQKSKPKTQTEHYECWKVGTGSLAFGPKIAPQFLSHKRGQFQLRKIAAVFKEASQFDTRALNEQDSRVKAILKSKNEREKKQGTKRKWHLVAGRVISRDPGRTGMVTVERAMVVLVRRG